MILINKTRMVIIPGRMNKPSIGGSWILLESHLARVTEINELLDLDLVFLDKWTYF